MPSSSETAAPEAAPNQIDPDFHQSLMKVMADIVRKLPDEATLGQLIDEIRSSRQMSVVMEHMTVQELIDLARQRPEQPAPNEPEITFDEEGNPILNLQDTGPAVVRRRADVPDGDICVLRCLADEGALSESALCRQARLTSEQIRLIVRHLRSKGHVHVEGSGTKRKIKITRTGSGYLRRNR